MTSDGDVLDALWRSDPRTDPATHTRRFRAFPSTEDPRLLIPTRPHRAAAAALEALRDRRSLKARAKTQLARAAIAVGHGNIELPDPEILEAVLRHLPEANYTYGVHLGPPRANRKPVFALVTTSGLLAAFAKCGVDDLTNRLVRSESEALSHLAGLASVTVPRHLGAGEIGGHAYLVQSPVPTSGIGPADSPAVVAAQVEVAAIGNETAQLGVASALDSMNQRWQARAEKSTGSQVTRQFAALAAEWATDVAKADVPWGSWHGDWRTTNMAVNTTGPCSIWDWERFSTGVPAGYDALHLFLTSQVSSDINVLPARLYAQAERLLRPFGVRTPQNAELVTTGYLLELAGRYLDDDQTRAGARLGSVGEWLLPHLQDVASRQLSRAPKQGAGES